MTNIGAARLMDGANLSRQILAETTDRASGFAHSTGRRPCLAAVLVGEDPASVTYVKMKRSRCEKTGIDSRLEHLAAGASTSQIVDAVAGLSADPSVDGILVQHPVPAGVDERDVFEAISPAKDVDGVTMHSFAAMAFERRHQGSNPARRAESSAFWTPTVSIWPAATRSSLVVVPSWANRWACSSWPATPRSPTATPAQPTCPT